MTEGKLRVTKKKAIQVEFINKNGKPVTMQLRQGEPSAEVAKLPLEKFDGMEVELDEEGGQPRGVRPKGQPFTPPPEQLSSQQARSGEPEHVEQVRPGSNQAGPTNPRPAEFHHPYNFVPALPRDKLPEYNTQAGIPAGRLEDEPPVGHHRYFPERISGVIRLKLTVVTPLLLPDASHAEEVENGHKSFPVRLDDQGQPYLPPTSIKGMLRSAYEAVTNSRLGVFAGWDRRLAFRRQARIDVEPARIERIDKDAIVIRVFKKRWANAPPRLRRYKRNGTDRQKGQQQAALGYDGTKELPQNGDHVWVKVDSKGFVTAIKKYDDKPKDSEWYEGWVLVTGPNIGNKIAERVFVVSQKDELITLCGEHAREVHRLWSDLIKDYQETHKKDIETRHKAGKKPSDYLGDKPGQTAWSTHVYDSEAANLRPGTLCYVRRQDGKITGIYPVAISRDLYPVSPQQLLPESLQPATDRRHLSSADRVFGWVNQKGHGAYRGQVRIGPVRCETPAKEAVENFGSPGLPLAILGQPKPQQARFYVAQSPDGKAQKDGLSKEEVGYSEGKGLRGRKVYPHHRHLTQPNTPAEYWNWHPANPDPTQQPLSWNGKHYFREYLRPIPTEEGKSQRDDQNRSVQGWIKPGTVFVFDLYVTNLSPMELGALLWLLSLPEGHYHRLGGAKPYGFGSVRLEIVQEHTKLYDGNSWKQYYSIVADDEIALGRLNQYDQAAAIDAFKRAGVEAYGPNGRQAAGSQDID